jgi:hypothetical protein
MFVILCHAKGERKVKGIDKVYNIHVSTKECETKSQRKNAY